MVVLRFVNFGQFYDAVPGLGRLGKVKVAHYSVVGWKFDTFYFFQLFYTVLNGRSFGVFVVEAFDEVLCFCDLVLL